MARLSCASCGATVTRDEVICPGCGAVLFGSDAIVESAGPPGDADDPLGSDGDSVAIDGSPTEASEPARCPHCFEPLISREDVVCLHCLREIAHSKPTAGQVTGLAIIFRAGELRVARGEELILGRDPSYPTAATLAPFDNVSRRHASVGLDVSGQAWVVDHDSTNGTYIDGIAVMPGRRTPLDDGAQLRLASDVAATIRRIELGGAS